MRERRCEPDEAMEVNHGRQRPRLETNGRGRANPAPLLPERRTRWANPRGDGLFRGGTLNRFIFLGCLFVLSSVFRTSNWLDPLASSFF
jgi:hypothetical protein